MSKRSAVIRIFDFARAKRLYIRHRRIDFQLWQIQHQSRYLPRNSITHQPESSNSMSWKLICLFTHERFFHPLPGTKRNQGKLGLQQIVVSFFPIISPLWHFIVATRVITRLSRVATFRDFVAIAPRKKPHLRSIRKWRCSSFCAWSERVLRRAKKEMEMNRLTESRFLRWLQFSFMSLIISLNQRVC